MDAISTKTTTKTTTMINTIITHTSPQGDPIRTVTIDDTPYFVGKDVCLALGYVNPRDAMDSHCKGVAKRYPLSTAGGVQEIRIIAEPDMYRLICSSKLPTAQKFEAWVFEEVLPSIRKHGGYIAPAPGETPEQLMARALKAADDTLKEYRERNRQLADKVEADAAKVRFADAVADSDRTCLVGELAKILRQNGVKIGQNRMFAWLRENKFLDKCNIPLQWAMERGLFRIIERTIGKPDGTSLVSRTTKVTGKGQQYIIDRFLNPRAVCPTVD